jgi:hypothetical protein
MQNYNVIETEETKQKVIIHRLDVGADNLEVRRYTAVLGGLSWPIGSLPPYYCILGEEWKDPDILNKKGRQGPLMFFAEYQAESPIDLDRFYLKLTDDVVKFHCKTVYTPMDNEWQDQIEAYQRYLRKKNIGLGDLDEAPFAGDFSLGISIANRWIKKGKLVLPEGIVRSELKQLNEESLAENPETKFLAANGLRYVIGAFRKHSPRPLPDGFYKRKKRGGWMAH